MIKTAIATLAAAAVAAPSAALAGPYVNVELNSSFTGSDYTSTTTDFHVGYELPWVTLLPGTSKQVLLSSLLTAALLTPFLRVRQV